MYGFDDDHQSRVVDEDQICDDDCPSALDIGEIAYWRVDDIEGIACNVEHQIVEGKPLDPNLQQHYDLNFQFS